MEYGVIIPKGISYIRKQIPLILEDAENALTVLFRELLSELYDDSGSRNLSVISRLYFDLYGLLTHVLQGVCE